MPVTREVQDRRRRDVLGFSLEPLQPTQYSDERMTSRQTSAVNPDNVTNGQVPRRFSPTATANIIEPALQKYHEFLASDHFPSRIFEPGGEADALRNASRRLANTPPSGESGLSHILQVALFAQLDLILEKYLGNNKRCWRIVGIGGAGKTDWALQIDGKTVFVLELKPQKIIDLLDMCRAVDIVGDGVTISSTWANSNDKSKRLIYQLSSPAVNRTAKYAAILNETCLDADYQQRRFFAQRGSLLLFERSASVIKVGTTPITEDPGPTTLQENTFYSILEVLLGLSLLDLDAYSPPTYDIPEIPPVPSLAGSTPFTANAVIEQPLRRSGRINHTTADSVGNTGAAGSFNVSQVEGSGSVHSSGRSSLGSTATYDSDGASYETEISPPVSPELSKRLVNRTDDDGSLLTVRSDSYLSPDPMSTEHLRVNPRSLHDIAFRPVYVSDKATAWRTGSTAAVDLNVEAFVKQGSLWTVFQASFGPIRQRQALKLCDPAHFQYRLDDTGEDYGHGQHSPDSARRAIEEELDLMRGPLKHLQPSSIPSAWGYWMGIFEGRQIWVCVQEWSGEDLSGAPLSSADKSQILARYRELHAAGVLHGDANARNWVRGPHQRIRLIDFNLSKTRADLDSPACGSRWDFEAASEMNDVRDYLGVRE